MTRTPIVISAITKKFNRHTVLSDVSLTVDAGTIYGFLGPNGAGKSTTIRCLFGLITPNSGSIALNGRDPRRDAAGATRRAALVPSDAQLWPNLTGRQVLDALDRLRASSRSTVARRNALIERFELDPSKKIRSYSRGNRQKVVLISALAADVDVIVLDEPTSGLDPLVQKTFGEVIRERKDEGVAILMSSHILSEVQELADSVSIIRDGRIVAADKLANMAHIRGSRIRATYPDGRSCDEIVATDKVNAFLAELIDADATDITAEPVSLEELFLTYYREDSHV